MPYFLLLSLKCVTIFVMVEDKKIHWLTRRLGELGKSKRQLALTLGVNPNRMNDLENGVWRFQASHIRKAAEFLEFDRTAFLDFVSGDITEAELWASKPPIKITDEDLALLKAVKSIATRPTDDEKAQNLEKSPKIPTAAKEQIR